uniref:Uncharacterized protein n=1 Tax=Anopheles maculatus TaxID=74869 RepID=A0A182S7I0_9DIPT
MAKFIATLCLLWLSVLMLIGFASQPAVARRHPLLIEDEGARRNRPAEFGAVGGSHVRLTEAHATWYVRRQNHWFAYLPVFAGCEDVQHQEITPGLYKSLASRTKATTKEEKQLGKNTQYATARRAAHSDRRRG